MRGLVLLALLTGCAPVFYGSVVYDLETTLACEYCREVNPLVPDIRKSPTKRRVVLYGYAAITVTAYTWLVEKTKYRKILYAIPTFLHLYIGTRNLRYVNY